MSIVERAERIYSRIEHRADAVIHVLGVLFAINASLWLLFRVTGLSVVVSVSIYCAGLLAMILASAAYNLTPQGRTRDLLRRFDHSAIFIMIAATYTPIAVNRIAFPYGAVILALIWLGASIGVTLKMVFPRRFEIASIALYLGMGWLAVTVLCPLWHSMAVVDFWLLVAGGLVYSAGVIFYVADRIPFHKAIWHGFVLTAVTLQFAAISLEFAH